MTTITPYKLFSVTLYFYAGIKANKSLVEILNYCIYVQFSGNGTLYNGTIINTILILIYLKYFCLCYFLHQREIWPPSFNFTALI